MGEVTVGAIKAEFERRVAAGEFVARAQPPGAPGRAFTTREMIALERETIEMMRAGQQTQPALVQRPDAPRHRADACAPERRPARGRRAHPRQPRSGPGARRRRGRRQDHGPGGRARGSRARGLPRRRVRADVARRAEARRGRHRRRPRCSAICCGARRARRGPTPLGVSTCSTNPVSPARGRCTRSCIASARPTACCSWAMCASTRPWKPAGPISSSRRRASTPSRLDDIVRQQDPALKAVVEQPGARRGA